MAMEGNCGASLSVNKGNYTLSRSANINFTVTGTHFSAGVQSIGLTNEVLAISTDVAICGYAFFRNLDTTNVVTVGHVVSGTYYPILKLLPGQIAVCPLALGNAAVYAQADTAAVDLEYQVYEA